MPLFQAAIISENDEDGQTPPNDFTGRMLGVDVVNGVTEPEKWRDIRRFAAKGFVTGEAGSEKMNRLERLAKHGPIPRLPTEEELEAIDVPEEFEDVSPAHNERLKLMKEQGFDPFEVVSHLNKEQSLAFFWVFEKGVEVLEDLDLEDEPPEEEKEEAPSDDTPPTEASVSEDGEGAVEDKAEEEDLDGTPNAPEEGEDASEEDEVVDETEDVGSEEEEADNE